MIFVAKIRKKLFNVHILVLLSSCPIKSYSFYKKTFKDA